jgi:hypothetical protein
MTLFFLSQLKNMEENMEERCPKCGAFAIEWNGREYECLHRDCRHSWASLEGGPKKYDDIKNTWLRCSFPPGAIAP